MNESHTLIQTYLRRKYFISTIFRRASTPQEIWYYETIVWEWDNETKERGAILDSMDSGRTETLAIINHAELYNKYL